jgi:hypothetical protein
MAEAAAPGANEWPRVIVRNGVTNTIYQPQLASWDYHVFEATSAVAVQPAGARQPTFGTIQFTATTHVDRAKREVTFEKLQIVEGTFPSAGAKADEHLARLRSIAPREVQGISLDRLEASLAILEAREKGRRQPLRNSPPVILFSTEPALLVLVDGPPVYRPVEKTTLERIVNTRALILREKSGLHFLHLFDGYVQAPELGGPWTMAKSVPADMKKAERAAVAAKQVDLLVGQVHPETKRKPSLKSPPLPQVHIATEPTELIVFHGEPLWAPIPSTQLLCATNTTAHVFKHLTDQKTYVLISGRWFQSSSLDGPWEFVSGAGLPPDFANIPDESPQENAKASVPGTRQAEEAVIATSIPSMVKVDRKKAKLIPAPRYDGPPLLKPLEGTSMQYVANCTLPVIQSNSTSWYACQNGVWFAATAAGGPWVVATSVPAEIYSIPPSSPLHYVVYARIYDYDEDYVWVGTTPGYFGTMIGEDGVVVYGTGYVHPPYIGIDAYVSYWVTYGYGSTLCWTPWVGWYYGFGVGWALEDDWYWWYGCPPAPYWGPYWYPCYGAYYNAYGGITAWGPYGWAGTSGYIYHQHGVWTGVSRGAAGYNAWTGNRWASSYGRAYNSTTGTRIVGQRGVVQNVYSGNYAYGGRGSFSNPNSGVSGVGGKVTWGNAATGNQGTAGRAAIYNPNTGQITQIAGGRGDSGGFIAANGHVIAARNGNYYRSDGQGGWEQITRPAPGASRLNEAGSVGPGVNSRAEWSRVQSSQLGAQQARSLNNEYYSRQWGAQRQQSFQAHRPVFRGGGGFRRR